jgi:nuclear pore complex protein Nup107
MFLRRVRDTAARGPGASALGGGGVPGTGAKSPMPMPGHPPFAAEPFAAKRVGTPDTQESFEHDDASCARSEERAFARVLADVRAGAVAEAETPAAFESVCRVRAAELRAAAADAARASTAQELLCEADDLDAEAATWSLAWFLLGEGAEAEREGAAAETRARDAIARRQRAGGDPASRFAGGAPNADPLPAPLSARVRMAARDETRDPVTFRANRVVAWLEGNARAAMTREAEGVEVAGALRWTDLAAFRDGGSSVAPSHDAFGIGIGDFARNECAWNETARALDASATSDGRGRSLTTELDPDGPARANGALHPTNADAETRLCRAAFRLVRGGMMDAARELCVRAGQPWRAASLGGAAPGPGGFAPAPVGAAADAAFAASAAFPVAAATEAARRARAEAGSAMDADGRQAFAETDTSLDDEAAFEAIAAAADSPATDAEDEELAAECDDVGSASSSRFPKSGTRRRALWKWACAETARQILAAPTAAPSARLEAALYGACAGDVRATLPACEGDWEASAWAYFRALLDARVDAAVDGAPHEGAQSQSQTPGPGPGPGPALLDDDDAGAGAEDDAAFETAPRWPTAASAAATPRTAEEILETLRPLAAREARGARARLAQRDAQRCLILGRTRELAAEAAPQWVFPSGEDFEAMSEDNAMSSASMSSASPPPGLLRFAAHLLLFLQTALPEGGGLQAGGALHFHLNKVVNLYVVHLVARRRYALVPRYARHLRAPVRLETYARFLSLLAPASLETKKRIIQEALEWIPMEHEGGLRAIVARALDDSREVVDPLSGAAAGAAATRGPRHREDVLEWACVAGADTHAEAATHACALVRQLCLSRTSAAVAAENERRVGNGGETVRGEAASAPDGANAGEARARRVVAELLPADLQANAAEADAPGAAAELSDWAAYLSAASSLRAWRDAAEARDAAAAMAGAGGARRRRRRRRRRGGIGARRCGALRARRRGRGHRARRAARARARFLRVWGWRRRGAGRAFGRLLAGLGGSRGRAGSGGAGLGVRRPPRRDAAGGASSGRAGFRRRLRGGSPPAPRVRGGAAARRRDARGRAPGPRRARRGGARRGGRRRARRARGAPRGRAAPRAARAGPARGGRRRRSRRRQRPRAGRAPVAVPARVRGAQGGAGRARARGGRGRGTRASGRVSARVRARVQPGDLRLRRVGSRNRARDLPRRAVAEPSARGRRRRGRPGRGLERGRGAGGGRAQGAARALLQARDGGAGRGAENRRAQRARRRRQRSLKCVKNGVFFYVGLFFSLP